MPNKFRRDHRPAESRINYECHLFFFFLLQSGFQFRFLLDQETTKLLPPVLIRFDRKKLAVVLDICTGYKLVHSSLTFLHKEYGGNGINKIVDQRAALKNSFARMARHDRVNYLEVLSATLRCCDTGGALRAAYKNSTCVSGGR
jgi:hypothetical protein